MQSSSLLLKIRGHLLRCCAQINPQRIKDTPAVNLCSRLVSAPSISKGLRKSYNRVRLLKMLNVYPIRLRFISARLLAFVASIFKKLTEKLYTACSFWKCSTYQNCQGGQWFQAVASLLLQTCSPKMNKDVHFWAGMYNCLTVYFKRLTEGGASTSWCTKINIKRYQYVLKQVEKIFLKSCKR